jgi:UDP:flavonoid glycosyltransferase YjiC (YdhE family)
VQATVGAVLEKAGPGVFLEKHANVGRIRAAVSTVLHNPSYRVAAARIGYGIRRRDGAEVAADAISHFTKTYVPH